MGNKFCRRVYEIGNVSFCYSNRILLSDGSILFSEIEFPFDCAIQDLKQQRYHQLKLFANQKSFMVISGKFCIEYIVDSDKVRRRSSIPENIVKLIIIATQPTELSSDQLEGSRKDNAILLRPRSFSLIPGIATTPTNILSTPTSSNECFEIPHKIISSSSINNISNKLSNNIVNDIDQDHNEDHYHPQYQKYFLPQEEDKNPIISNTNNYNNED